MAELLSWLEKHGLGKYAQVFADNDIDLDILPELTESVSPWAWASVKGAGCGLRRRLRSKT